MDLSAFSLGVTVILTVIVLVLLSAQVFRAPSNRGRRH